MSRQRPGNPRFYIDFFQWAFASGIMSSKNIIDKNNSSWSSENDDWETKGSFINVEKYLKLFSLNPSENVNLKGEWQNYESFGAIDILIDMPIKGLSTDYFDYFGVFGHDLYFANGSVLPYPTNPTGGMSAYNISESYNSINANFAMNGFTLINLNKEDGNPVAIYGSVNTLDYITIQIEKGFSEYENFNINAISLGKTYQLPHSPELNVTMTRDFGIDKQKTIGGHILTNRKNPKNMWGNLPAWELSSQNIEHKSVNKGRRSWKISFKEILDEKLFNYYDGIYPSDDDNVDTYGLLNEDNFYNTVLHKTMGGQLPFIFQPDGDNYNLDQYALVKIKQNSIQFNQVGHNVYNITLTLVEVF